MEPRISVIIPVYNAKSIFPYAVESTIQFDEVYEVILVRDKSFDNTLQIARDYAPLIAKSNYFNTLIKKITELEKAGI